MVMPTILTERIATTSSTYPLYRHKLSISINISHIPLFNSQNIQMCLTKADKPNADFNYDWPKMFR